MARMYDDHHGEDSEFISHVPCDNCGSSDANSLYTDGHQFCFACDTWKPGDGDTKTTQRSTRKMSADVLRMGECEGAFEALAARQLTKETCQKYGYWVGKLNGKRVQVANYYDHTGSLVGQKTRDKDKNFSVKGDVGKEMLWGSHLWSGGGKMIVITEGEIDCMTVAQLQNLKWPVVSLANGAKAARKTCAANYEYLDGYEKIVLMFDMDEPGREAVMAAAEVLPQGKVFVAQLPMKDANECLINGHSKDIMDAIWNASPYRPDGIVSARDLIKRALEKADVESVPFPLGSILNEKTRGMRGGEVIMLTSGSGMGKSSFAREVAYGLGHQTGLKGGLAFIEEDVTETMLDIAGLHLNKRIRQFPEMTNDAEKEKALTEVFENDTFHLYDHFGSAEEDSLIGKLRYMATVLECKWAVLDHISIVVSGMDGNEDERKTIDRLMTKLKTLAKATGMILIVITHLKRKDGKSKGHEEGAQISLSELRGSGAIAQLSDTVIGFERDQQGEMPNMVLIRILKCRFTGDTGEAGFLEFNKVTGRMKDYLGEPSWEPSGDAGPDEEF